MIIFVYLCVNAGAFGARICPPTPTLPSCLLAVYWTAHEMSGKLAWHNCTHFVPVPYSVPGSSPVSLTFLSDMSLCHALSTTLGDSMLVGLWQSLHHGLGDQAPLSVLYRFAPSVPATLQLRQISLTVTM